MCTRSTEGSKQRQWYPPPTGHSQLDVVAHKDQQNEGLGDVIRYCHGQVIAAALKSSRFQENESTAEAEAVKWGTEVAKEARLTAVIVETDCNEVVGLANNKICSRMEIFWIISEIQRCERDFQNLNMLQDLVMTLLTLLLKEP